MIIKTKLARIFTAAALVVMVGMSPGVVHAQADAATLAALQAQIQLLLQQISALQAQLNNLAGSTTPPDLDPSPGTDIPPDSIAPTVTSVASKASGPYEIVAGERAYVVGSGFLPANTVHIGATRISAPWTSPTYLTFIVPEDMDPGRYEFSVSNDNGTSAARIVNVSAIGQPYLKLLSPEGGRVFDAGRRIAVNWEWSGIDAVRFDLCILNAGQKICKSEGPLMGVSPSGGSYSLWLDPNHPYFPSRTVTLRAEGLRNGSRVVRDETGQFEVRVPEYALSEPNTPGSGAVAGAQDSQMASILNTLQAIIDQLPAAFGL